MQQFGIAAGYLKTLQTIHALVDAKSKLLERQRRLPVAIRLSHRSSDQGTIEQVSWVHR
jgi:hypothetical protein